MRRIDEKVFVVAPNVEELLSEHYSKEFGFIIAKINDNEEKHPLGYIHTIDDDSKELFVPTRHQHGKGVEKVSHWDHEIYSVGCTRESAGDSTNEVRDALLLELKSEHKKHWSLVEGKNPTNTLASLPKCKINYNKDLRLWTRKGKEKNEDVIFKVTDANNNNNNNNNE